MRTARGSIHFVIAVAIAAGVSSVAVIVETGHLWSSLLVAGVSVTTMVCVRGSLATVVVVIAIIAGHSRGGEIILFSADLMAVDARNAASGTPVFLVETTTKGTAEQETGIEGAVTCTLVGAWPSRRTVPM